MKHRSIALAAALALGGITTAPLAQQPAAPGAAVPAQTTPAAAAPKHTCAKPGDYPGNLASDNQRRPWQKSYVDYVDCLKAFVKEQQALAEPHVRASNEAIEEHNNAIKEYNAQIEKAKGN